MAPKQRYQTNRQEEDGSDDEQRDEQGYGQGEEEDRGQGNGQEEEQGERDEEQGKGEGEQGEREEDGRAEDNAAEQDNNGEAEDDNGDADDEPSTAKSKTMHVNLAINLDLPNAEMHKGGIIFSKKLLAALFSGGDDVEEQNVEDIDHEHVETDEGDGDWTVVELQTYDASGATLYLKAKLDSAADDNFMSYTIYEVTGLDFTPIEGPEGPPTYITGSGDDTTPLGTVQLGYTAGIKPQRFVETFQVLDGLPHDLILGKDLMKRAHMLMINPNFAHPPAHKKFCSLELAPKDKASRAKAEAVQRQKAQEKAQELRDMKAAKKR